MNIQFRNDDWRSLRAYERIVVRAFWQMLCLAFGCAEKCLSDHEGMRTVGVSISISRYRSHKHGFGAVHDAHAGICIRGAGTLIA
jgi:hypothetical protein